MSAEPAPLRAVTGEIPQTYEQAVQAWREEQAAYRELEHRFKAAMSQIAQMKKDREKEARGSALWLVGERLFVVWCKATGHVRKNGKPTQAFSFRRFEFIEPYLRDLLDDEGELKADVDQPLELIGREGAPADPYERCAAAILGRAAEHFTKERANGTLHRYNEWERVFKNDGEFNESMARRPRDWRQRLAELDPGPIERGPRRV